MTESKPKEVRTILQIMPAQVGWSVAFADEDTGDLSEWPLAAWALVEAKTVHAGSERVLRVDREVVALVDNEFGDLEEASTAGNFMGTIPLDAHARSVRLEMFKMDAKVHAESQKKRREAEAAALKAATSKKTEGLQ